MIDKDPIAAKMFYRLVREFALNTKTWQTAIFYQTLPDEYFDLSLVSQRVYGNRNEFLAVMASAGIDHFDQKLKEQRLILPTQIQLALFKRQAGFESNPTMRENFAPTWID